MTDVVTVQLSKQFFELCLEKRNWLVTHYLESEPSREDAARQLEGLLALRRSALRRDIVEEAAQSELAILEPLTERLIEDKQREYSRLVGIGRTEAAAALKQELDELRAAPAPSLLELYSLLDAFLLARAVVRTASFSQ